MELLEYGISILIVDEAWKFSQFGLKEDDIPVLLNSGLIDISAGQSAFGADSKMTPSTIR